MGCGLKHHCTSSLYNSTRFLKKSAKDLEKSKKELKKLLFSYHLLTTLPG
jgi:hypothetical protein